MKDEFSSYYNMFSPLILLKMQGTRNENLYFDISDKRGEKVSINLFFNELSCGRHEYFLEVTHSSLMVQTFSWVEVFVNSNILFLCCI